ncbi:DUF2785 domain-containing protein [Paucisalibacillus sp. EB02]|uniref:DUF2785 domain-containing protein n=1 Tax=Paucisalibacillus sp. EB02 TaxID=1347087 RepID=UPI0004AFD29F|nr:DUF2785 domain-containing protein [Paucisalibacillus sp. EB02]
MEKKELQSILTNYRESNFESIGLVDKDTVTKAMLYHIGSTDPELRDHLIYPSFLNLMINNYYSRPELNRIMNVCLDDEHLFYKINESDKDSVFTRAFSSLIIAALLHINRQNTFLANDEIDEIAVRLVDYVKQEEDVRGFVEEKGWAHSIAHIADALDELVKQPQLSNARLKEITLTILDKMYFDKGYFLFEEDERMVTTLISILQRGIDQQLIYEKIDALTGELKQNFVNGNIGHFMQRLNFKQFLRSLLLHLEVINKQEELRTHLKQALISINQSYYNT